MMAGAIAAPATHIITIWRRGSQCRMWAKQPDGRIAIEDGGIDPATAGRVENR